MDDTQIGTVDAEPGSSDQQIVSEGASFFDRFFGNIGACYDQHPIAGQDAWKKQVALGFVGGFVLFLVLGFVTKPRSTTG